jgi:2',3'-cyclic-nucleotide 2'-phosphodiesterase/3'-nucleotidase
MFINYKILQILISFYKFIISKRTPKKEIGPMQRLFIVIAILSIISTACQKGKVELHIIETTDIHGHFFDYDFTRDTFRTGSLSQFATYLDSIRAIQKNLVLLDNGDIIQGDPAVFYSNYIDTSSTHILTNIYKTLNYDVATVGNHDIEAGPDVYNKLKKELPIPWLGANIIEKNNDKPAFKPFHIIEKDGVKIAIIGITTPGIPNWLPQKLYEGLRFDGMVSTAKKWMTIVAKENPDIVIGLFHAGLNNEYGGFSPNDPLNPNATLDVAREVEGFDIIFAGHDHRRKVMKVASKSGDSVLIVNGGSHAKFAGHVKLTYNKDTRTIASIDATIDNIQKVKSKTKFNSEFKPFLTQAKAFFNEPIGELNTKLCPQEALFGPSAFMQFIHDVQLFHTKADVSLSAPLQINQCINSGEIYRSDIFALYRYENYLASMNMTVAEIDAFLEYGIKGWFNTMTQSTDYLLQYKEENRLAHPYYNFSTAEGIEYTIDVRAPIGEKITITKIGNNKSFNTIDTLRVALNSYRMVGGGGHLPRGVNIDREELKKRNVVLSDKPIKSIMMQFFLEKSPVNTNNTINWKLIPEKWVTKAKEKEITNF